MRKNKEWSYFEFEVGRYLPWGWEWGDTERDPDFKQYKPETKKLVWYVFNEENGKIVPINLFEYNWVFLCDLLDAKKKYGKDFIKFADRVRSCLQHEYWARSEYETIITTWAPCIDEEELDRLNAERKEHEEKYPNSHLYRQSVNLCYSPYKMDIYTQVIMNWDRFIEYVFNNQHLITAKKLGIEDIVSRKKKK